MRWNELKKLQRNLSPSNFMYKKSIGNTSEQENILEKHQKVSEKAYICYKIVYNRILKKYVCYSLVLKGKKLTLVLTISRDLY